MPTVGNELANSAGRKHARVGGGACRGFSLAWSNAHANKNNNNNNNQLSSAVIFGLLKG